MSGRMTLEEFLRLSDDELRSFVRERIDQLHECAHLPEIAARLAELRAYSRDALSSERHLEMREALLLYALAAERERIEFYGFVEDLTAVQDAIDALPEAPERDV